MNSKKLTRRGFMLRFGALASAVSSALVPSTVLAAPAGALSAAKLTGSNKELKFALTLNAPVAHKVFTLPAPERVVIDLQQTQLQGKLKSGSHNRPPLRAIRHGIRNGNDFRVVLDMTDPVNVTSQLKTVKGGKHQLIVSIKPKSGTRSSSAARQPQREQPVLQRAAHKPVNAAPSRGQFVVAIDAGHGGRDPGAIGRKGTREKDIVLAVARKLKARIDSTPGMRAIMTRNGDKYISLRKRMDIAHQHKADLFVSIHADANNNSRVNGSSVYILSNKGASSEAARLLAKSENSYDLKFGNVKHRDNQIASVLLDLSQDATMDLSLDLAKGVLGELKRVNNPLRNRVESAGFMVLKSPDIPSMLVETAFISNPTEEKRLRTSAYQQKLADAMWRGVRRYQQAHAPKPINYSSGGGKYTVRAGDTLSGIAVRHGVSVASLRNANRLRSDSIRSGQRLTIPKGT